LAAEGGHLECLQYAHQQGCPWDVRTCTNAKRGGHLKCLQYAHEQGCPWNEYTCALTASWRSSGVSPICQSSSAWRSMGITIDEKYPSNWL
jgi:hypothetical protein